ncbi:MAG: gamma-glutamyl-phosphate reductase, partial [Betaproteobacteria bacterium]
MNAPLDPALAAGSLAATMQTLGQGARAASAELARASTAAKDDALLKMAQAIRARRADIAAANARDVDRAAASGLDAALLDRLRLTDKNIE